MIPFRQDLSSSSSWAQPTLTDRRGLIDEEEDGLTQFDRRIEEEEDFDRHCQSDSSSSSLGLLLSLRVFLVAQQYCVAGYGSRNIVARNNIASQGMVCAINLRATMLQFLLKQNNFVTPFFVYLCGAQM